jgi:hypothetical protein
MSTMLHFEVPAGYRVMTTTRRRWSSPSAAALDAARRHRSGLPADPRAQLFGIACMAGPAALRWRERIGVAVEPTAVTS